MKMRKKGRKGAVTQAFKTREINKKERREKEEVEAVVGSAWIWWDLPL